MRKALLPSLLATFAVLAVSGPAEAADEYDVKVEGNKITVTTKGAWHVNKEYPWKLTVGDTKLAKDKFTLADTKAELAGAPKGEGTLKIGVCSAGTCLNREVAVSIK